MNLKCLFVLLVAVVVTSAKSFNGYKLYKVDIKTEDDLKAVKDVQTQNFGEFWEEDFDVNHEVKIMVAPENQSQFLKVFKIAGVDVIEVIEDMQRYVVLKIY